jgi:hypothetical protein
MTIFADVLAKRALWSIEQADCLDYLRRLPADSVDLVFGSPPYEQARTYLEDGQDLGIARNTEEWVAWLVEVYRECLRVCVGLTALVVEGQTRRYRYSCGPALLMADLHRAGFCLRKPPVFHRVGIPGSGGPDWLRNDWEWIVCATRPGKLPWSDNTAMGHPPRWAPGGAMAHRLSDGTRVNQWGRGGGKKGMGNKDRGGQPENVARPSHRVTTKGATRLGRGASKELSGSTKGTCAYRLDPEDYTPPTLANPGNVIRCNVGGGQLGDDLAHANEAPFPEALAEFFVRSFCPEGGIALDPLLGSGTTLAVALKWGRRGLGCDLRASQVELATRRLNQHASLFDGVEP